MNELTTYDNLFEVESGNDDLSAGVSGGFGIVSIRGAKWRIKQGGEEKPVLTADGDPVATLPVVLVQASKEISRIYYAKSYEEGDDAAPDCWSTDGHAPDADATNKQSVTCAACPNGVWGSKITPAGKKSKLCQDSRRVVVVPAADIPNAIYGGPLQLRVPAASLGDLATYGKELQAKGFAYRAVQTRLGFDMNVSYPKLTFKAIKPLTDEEKEQVKAHFLSGAVDNILQGSAPVAAAPVAAAPVAAPVLEHRSVDATFEEDGEPEPAPVAAPAAKAKKATKAEKEEELAAPPAKASELDNALDQVLNDIDSL